MVALPLFKLGALFLRHVSKYGANRIKIQAHEHPKFRAIAARYGQTIHQINMRLSVAVLRDAGVEQRAKEKAETPRVKTEEQMKADEAAKLKEKTSSEKKESSKSIWKRKFRSLPEAKAVDLFADVIGDAFVLAIGVALIIYEYVRTSGKPDSNAVKIAELDRQLREEEGRIAELEETEKKQQKRVEGLEAALAALQDSPKFKKEVSVS